MPITTVKSSMSFPEAGQIRKGAPKEKRVKDGREYEVVGKDLSQAVRFVIFEGRDSAYLTQKIIDMYEGLTTTKPVLCMLPFAKVADCWEVWNEAYTGGRMIARADGERYIRYVNPETGAVEVDEGEPYKPFNGEREIIFKNKNGREVKLPIKPVGKLKVFLPELERFVWFTVKTTSFYDALNLEAQLSAIQGLADSLNNGSCAGIRFYLYRTVKDVTWNKPGGDATRVPKWLLNVEVDPEWVKSAVQRLSQFALTGHGTAAALLPQTISGTTDPDEPEHDEDDDPQENVISGEWALEEQPATETKTAPAASVVKVEQPKTKAAPLAQSNNAPLDDMSIEEAEREYSDHNKCFYGEVETDKLTFMFNGMKKVARPTIDQERKIKAVEIILAARKAGRAVAKFATEVTPAEVDAWVAEQ